MQHIRSQSPVIWGDVPPKLSGMLWREKTLPGVRHLEPVKVSMHLHTSGGGIRGQSEAAAMDAYAQTISTRIQPDRYPNSAFQQKSSPIFTMPRLDCVKYCLLKIAGISVYFSDKKRRGPDGLESHDCRILVQGPYKIGLLSVKDAIISNCHPSQWHSPRAEWPKAEIGLE